MRVIWRDSTAPTAYKPIKYRKHMIYGTPRGWTIDVEGDTNLYTCHYCAQNAIDQHYGDFGQRGTEKRRQYGIQIIGQKDQ